MGTTREGPATTPHEKLVQALAQVVRDFGPEVLTQPDRVRSALSDLLSDDAFGLRDDLSALVLAAELGIPSALEATDPAPDADELVQRLTDRGASPELAGLAVRLWSSSLDSQLPDTDLPDLPAPVARPASPGATDLPVDAPLAAPPATAAPAPGPWAVPSASPRRGGRVALLAGSLAITLVLATGGAVLLGGNDHGARSAEAASAEGQRTRRHETPTTTTTVKPVKPATPTPQPTPQPKAAPQPQPKAAPQPQPKAAPQPEPQPQPQPEPQPQPQPQPQPEPQPAPTISISQVDGHTCVESSDDPSAGLRFQAATTDADRVVWTSVSDQAEGFDYDIHFQGHGWARVTATATGPGGTASAAYNIWIADPSNPWECSQMGLG